MPIGEVLVVGAGPGGLTLANDLAMRGIPFRIIDAESEPLRESRAHGFGNRTLLALDKLGLAEPMLAAAKQPPPVLREYFGRRLAREQDLASMPRDPYPAMLAIFQQRVTRVLEAALVERGFAVEWSTRLRSATRDGGGIVAEVERDGRLEAIKAGWIVGCEGARSVVRTALALDDPTAKPSVGPTKSVFQAILCECDADWNLSRDVWWVWQSLGGSCSAIFNDFTGKWHIHAIDTDGAQATLERVEALLRHRSRIGDVHLTGADWVRRASFSSHAAKSFLASDGALVGDAAHTFNSVAGQGLHFAIEDAINLGWKLALTIQGAASPSLLETYETERRERYEDALAQTRGSARLLSLPAWVAKPFWAAAYLVGSQRRSTTAAASQQSEQLKMCYPVSPLTRQESPQATDATRAGMHVPDAPCHVGGAPSRLFEIIQGAPADLLLFAGLTPNETTIGELRSVEMSVEALRSHLRVHWAFPSQAHASKFGFRDDDPGVVVDGFEALYRAFGIKDPEVVYLRPDGYVGLRSANLEIESLLTYLKLIYRSPAGIA